MNVTKLINKYHEVYTFLYNKDVPLDIWYQEQFNEMKEDPDFRKAVVSVIRETREPIASDREREAFYIAYMTLYINLKKTVEMSFDFKQLKNLKKVIAVYNEATLRLDIVTVDAMQFYVTLEEKDEATFLRQLGFDERCKFTELETLTINIPDKALE